MSSPTVSSSQHTAPVSKDYTRHHSDPSFEHHLGAGRDGHMLEDMDKLHDIGMLEDMDKLHDIGMLEDMDKLQDMEMLEEDHGTQALLIFSGPVPSTVS
ncbi:hypothetical protein H2200_009476 [Cladophialophora chaetospira]|uniref:Uncharacterized protein n=1 Tax=Cladophialophora chaetospira TaxID=386627 RepID=A0AA38X2T6_9EURO|nr:hypothetical protein H2200_009476 [Cladophialophora chaetospira]